MNLDHRVVTTRVGRMTAAMRAAAIPNVAKVLRVATVRDGSITEERIFRERGRVDSTWPFDVERGGWVLVVPSGATGHVVTRDGRFDIGPHASRVTLDESARGKIVIGTIAILFQFVVPPPRPSRPQLPLATRRAEIDWALTMIVAFSFLVHFGFIGSIFSDWLDPVVADDGAVVGIVDLTSKLPTAPVIEDHETPSNTSASKSAHEEAATPRAPRTPQASADARAASLAREAESMKMSLLVAFGGETAVEGALRRSDVPTASLDEVARQAAGARNTSGELVLAEGRSVLPGSRGLNRLGDGRATEGTTREREVAGPRFDMTTRIYDPQPIIDIEGPIARLRPSFRSCYTRKGLDVDPAMEGKITIDIAIAPNGDVKDVTKISGAGLSPAVEACIIERAHNGSFVAPGGTGTHARVPIIFRQQR